MSNIFFQGGEKFSVGASPPAILWLRASALCHTFTPTRNAVDLSMHDSKKEHTGTWKNTMIESIRLMALTRLRWWNTSINMWH